MRLEKIKRRKWTWTQHRLAQGDQVIQVVNELRDFWPLTLRQIYYRLVAAGYLENTRSRYNDLSKLIKHMRLDDWLPWEVLEDRSRRVSAKRGWSDKDEFIEAHMEAFLSGYERCYVQDQERYVELWTEKDALMPVFERVAYPYCIRAVLCRGYQSITFKDAYRRRAQAALSRGQVPVLLYFGDLDPSGWNMLEDIKQCLEDEMDLYGVEYLRVALLPEQVQEFNLIHNPDALKHTDSRAKRYLRQFGHLAVELDALHPATLQEMAVQAIEAQFDMEAFKEQREIEDIERERLKDMKRHLLASLGRFD